MKLHIFTLLITCFSFSLFANTTNSINESSSIETSMTFSVPNPTISETINHIPNGSNEAYQTIEIINHLGSDNVDDIFNIELIDSNIPNDWELEYCGVSTIYTYEDCSTTSFETVMDEYDYLEMEFSFAGSSISATDEATFVYRIYNVNDPTVYEDLTFQVIIQTGVDPGPTTGFNIFSNESIISETSFEDNPVTIYNNIDIVNPNSSPVEIGWEILSQTMPSEWDVANYSFSFPFTTFVNQEIPTTGTFMLNPDDFYLIDMFTEVTSINGMEGTRTVEVRIFDVNNPTIEETLTFSATIEVAQSGIGFEVTEPVSTITFTPSGTGGLPNFFHSFEFENKNLYETTDISWKVLVNESPSEWILTDEISMQAVDSTFFYTTATIESSGAISLDPGENVKLDYRIHNLDYSNVSGTSRLDIVFYDASDSMNTAVVVSSESVVDLPELGTGYELEETSTNSVNYVDNSNLPIYAFMDPLFLTNASEDMIELGWEKISYTSPEDWEYTFDFNVHQDYYTNVIPDGGSFTLFPNNQAYFALNFNEIITNGTVGTAELQIRVFDMNDSMNYNHLLTFYVSVCIENNIPNVIIVPATTSYCAGDMITLESAAGLQNIQWSTGENTPTITIPVQEEISISAEDEAGCPQSDELVFEIEYAYDESVCLVSVDEATGNNMVVWEKTPEQNTASYNVYKETSEMDVYELIGSQPYADESTYVDATSNAMETSSRYKITAVSDCGAESELSAGHKTMHLTMNDDASNEVVLTWDTYEGLDYSMVNILRGTDPMNMELIVQLPSDNFTYTDMTTGGTYYYQVRIEQNGSCDPNGDIGSPRSNIVTYNNTTSNKDLTDHQIEVFPNPFSSEINLRNIPTDVHSLLIKDVSGRILLRSAVNDSAMSLNGSDLPSGMYFIEMTGEQVYISKIVK